MKRYPINDVPERILLAEIEHLPNLIDGKVVIFVEGNGYRKLGKPTHLMIQDGFDAIQYSILNSSKWHNLLVYSDKKEREQYLINKAYREMKGLITLSEEYAAPVPVPYRVGDKIHINSRRGIYELVEINGNVLKITCKRWVIDGNPFHYIPASDFKCLAGGIYNLPLV